MAHAPWIYGWWAWPQAVQARVLQVEVVFLFIGYVALALWAVSLRGLRAGDPAKRMMQDDDPEPKAKE